MKLVTVLSKNIHFLLMMCFYVKMFTAKKAGQMRIEQQTPVSEKTFGLANDETFHPGRGASTPEGKYTIT